MRLRLSIRWQYLGAAVSMLLGIRAAGAFTSGPAVPSRIRVGGEGAVEGWAALAMEALWRDGAVVLSGLDEHGPGRGEVNGSVDFRDIASALPASLFDGAGSGAPVLLSPGAPVNGVHDELEEAKSRGLYLPGSGLLPHTDGYVYGDDMPDFIFLLCEQASPVGGWNALLDGDAFLAGLAAGSPEQRHLADWLATTPVDLSESSETGIAQGRCATGPVVQHVRTPSNRTRLKWRRQVNVRNVQGLDIWQPLSESGTSDMYSACENSSVCRPTPETVSDRYLSLWRSLPSMDEASATETASRLREVDRLIQAASSEAFANYSFALSRGEALVLDNYRMLHARLPYWPGPGRRFWRVWSWTSDGTGLPPDGAQTSNPINDKVFQGV